MKNQSYIISSEHEMLAFADRFAKVIPTTGCIALWGDLGAGKTTFARQLIRSLAKDADLVVQSPTFTLVQLYEFPQQTLWHCDLYRLIEPEECLELGVLEAMQTALCLLEWPDRMGRYLPENRIDVRITVTGESERIVAL